MIPDDLLMNKGMIGMLPTFYEKEFRGRELKKGAFFLPKLHFAGQKMQMNKALFLVNKLS